MMKTWSMELERSSSPKGSPPRTPTAYSPYGTSRLSGLGHGSFSAISSHGSSPNSRSMVTSAVGRRLFSMQPEGPEGQPHSVQDPLPHATHSGAVAEVWSHSQGNPGRETPPLGPPPAAASVQTHAQGWAGLQALLGGVAMQVAAVPRTAVHQLGRSLSVRLGREAATNEEEDSHTQGSKVEHSGDGNHTTDDTSEGTTLAQRLAKEAARQLVGFLTAARTPELVQGALSLMMDRLSTQQLTAAQLMAVDVLPALSALLPSAPTAPPDETVCLAIEALSALVTEWAAVGASSQGARSKALSQQLWACVPGVLGVLHFTLATATDASHAHGRLKTDTHPQLEVHAHAEAEVRAVNVHPITFFACSICVRLVNDPVCAQALVSGGAIPLLSAALQLSGTGSGLFKSHHLLPQASLLALATLVKTGSHADNLLQILKAGAAPVLVASLWAKESGDDLNTRAVRDTAATLLLDMALLPEAPAHAADIGLAAVIVKLVTVVTDPAARMVGVLVLARLAHHSTAVQLDAVREGAVPVLVRMMQGTSEEEALHATRLLAILAQATSAHEALRTSAVMDALLGLLASPLPRLVEHVCSVIAIMANNPDTHFQIVGWGTVPLLVPLLAHDCPTSSAKTRTYVLASFLLLATHEARHADVLCRAGAVPLLVKLLRPDSATPPAHPHILHSFNAPPANTDTEDQRASAAGVTPTGAATSAPLSGATTPASSQAKASVTDVSSSRAEGSAAVREYAAAVISCLSRSVDIQAEIITAGGVPALVKLLSDEGLEAQCHAAEALVQLAVTDCHRRRLIVRATEILDSLVGLLRSPVPASRYWGATLLQLLCQDDAVLLEVIDLPAAQAAVVDLLLDQSSHQPSEVRRAQVQAAWLVARLCSAPATATQLASMGLVPPLMAMLGAGMQSAAMGMGGAWHGTAGLMLDQASAAMVTPGGAVTALISDLPPSSHGCNSGSVSGRRSPTRPSTPRRIEALDSNAHAAATAALLALARAGGTSAREEVERELLRAEAWSWGGCQVRLEGLNAPATA